MKRSEFLIKIAVSSIAVNRPISLIAKQATISKPNVLFLAVDDMNDWISPMHYKHAVTPNLDRLSKKGVTFQNAHTAGTYCAPSRSAIFTGCYASTTGCYRYQKAFINHPDIIPLQKVFNDAGYDTYGAGKLYHHGKGCIDQRGWNDYFFYNDTNRKNAWQVDSWSNKDIIPELHPKCVYMRNHKKKFLKFGIIPNENEEKMADTMRSEYGCKHLSKKHDKPFFLGVGFYAPHYPNYVPKKYFDLYNRDNIKLPPYKKDDLIDLPRHVQKRMKSRGKILAYLEKFDAYKDAVLAYLAAISYADAMIGRLLDSLEKGPNADNTIIVLWSDHGYHLGEKFQWGKHTLWKQTSNVPHMWAGPGIAKNTSLDVTVSLIDMFPTLNDLCDLKDKQKREGTSLAPILHNPANAKDRNVFLPGLKPKEYAIINKNWRYIHYSDKTEELYNVKKDINEWHNLAEDPKYDSIKKELRASAPKTFAKSDNSKMRLKITGDTYKWVKK